jgi:microcystin-dependent protein
MTTIYNHGIITFGSATITLPLTTGVLASTAYSLPIGSIFAYAGNTTAPDDWLFCDGSAVSRSTYAALFSVIGTNYGIGDGSTTFNLPKMMSGNNSIGIFPAGSATTANAGFNIDNILKIHNMNSNNKIGTNQIPIHNHTIPSHNHTIPSHNHTIPQHRHGVDHFHTQSHSHGITYTNSVNIGIYDITYSTDTQALTGTSNNVSAITGTSTNVPSGQVTNNSTDITSSTSIASNSNNSSVITSNTSTLTSSDSNVTTSDNSVSAYVDYVPSYTAFLWVIKYK